MLIDRGSDFPEDIQEKLDTYGPEMWLLRDNPDRGTTRALNSYKGDHRGYVKFNMDWVISFLYNSIHLLWSPDL